MPVTSCRPDYHCRSSRLLYSADSAGVRSLQRIQPGPDLRPESCPPRIISDVCQEVMPFPCLFKRSSPSLALECTNRVAAVHQLCLNQKLRMTMNAVNFRRFHTTPHLLIHFPSRLGVGSSSQANRICLPNSMLRFIMFLSAPVRLQHKRYTTSARSLVALNQHLLRIRAVLISDRIRDPQIQKGDTHGHLHSY